MPQLLTATQGLCWGWFPTVIWRAACIAPRSGRMPRIRWMALGRATSARHFAPWQIAGKKPAACRQRALLKASGKRAAAPLRQPGRASLRRQAESKTGANSEGSKCRFAQFPLGHHAMGRGAEKRHPSTAHGPARNAARAPDSRLMRRKPGPGVCAFLAPGGQALNRPQASRAWANSRALKVCRSSSFSPTPMK